MIQSMTGHGEATLVLPQASYAVELRSLNNRFFKAAIRLPDALLYLEPQVESLLRHAIGRGSIFCQLKLVSSEADSGMEINQAALRGFLRQVDQVAGEAGLERVGCTVDMAMLLTLPGVCQPRIATDQDREAQWSLVEGLLQQAIERLIVSRKREGQLIRSDLLAHCEAIDAQMELVRERAPSVVDDYRKRLAARITQLMEGSGATLRDEDLTREVAIFAERCDIHEEIQRLAIHVREVRELCDSAELAGRKLDFLAQELLREANTIASKANDAVLARAAVEIKARIDRIKEQVQNVE